MFADREAQPLPVGRLAKSSDDITLGAGCNRVPARLMDGVPQVEVVVVHGHAAEIPCASFLVHGKQVVGVEAVCLPERNQLFVADFVGWP